MRRAKPILPSSLDVKVEGWRRIRLPNHWLLRVGGWFKSLAAGHKARRDLLRAERELARMSDLDLADIGLGPADTAAILHAAYAARARGVSSWFGALGRSLAAIRVSSLLSSTWIG